MSTLGQQIVRVDCHSADFRLLGPSGKQRVYSSLPRSGGLGLVGTCHKQRGQQGGLACRSTWVGLRLLQQRRQLQSLTVTRTLRGARVVSLRARAPEHVFIASSAAWKASLLVNPVDLERVSCTSSSTFWPGIAAALRCVYPQQRVEQLDIPTFATSTWALEL